MNLQYITDSHGQTTGVFIPIEEWNDLKTKFKGIDQMDDVPGWHQEVVRNRIELTQKNPECMLDFDAAIDEVEKDI
jgi:N-methylhydantoinase B/oxoprolinase/acetone carboxylase alpha subunit